MLYQMFRVKVIKSSSKDNGKVGVSVGLGIQNNGFQNSIYCCFTNNEKIVPLTAGTHHPALK